MSVKSGIKVKDEYAVVKDPKTGKPMKDPKTGKPMKVIIRK